MTNDRLSEELSAHLVAEFGAHGERAVQYLRTAERMLGSAADESSPRHAECVAYCLREALKTIPESYAGLGGGEWRTRSRKVLDAKQRIVGVQGVPGADHAGELRELLASIDDLARTFEQETIHQKRLIAVMVERTGAEPLASGTRPVDAYQDLVSRVDQALHTGTSLAAVAGMRGGGACSASPVVPPAGCASPGAGKTCRDTVPDWGERSNPGVALGDPWPS